MLLTCYNEGDGKSVLCVTNKTELFLNACTAIYMLNNSIKQAGKGSAGYRKVTGQLSGDGKGGHDIRSDCTVPMPETKNSLICDARHRLNLSIFVLYESGGDTIKMERMERTIMFRKWDKNKLQMMHSPSVNIDFGAWWKEHCSDHAERENEIVLMQFTGVYDQYHQEVFEGDIVNYHTASDTHERAVVHYLTRYACFGVGENIPLRTIPHFEVIGNIFENPKDAPDECSVPLETRVDTLSNKVPEKIKDPASHHYQKDGDHVD